MREVQYDKKENFYLDLKCGPTQSHIWAVFLRLLPGGPQSS